jgi:hypothetical protein
VYFKVEDCSLLVSNIFLSHDGVHDKWKWKLDSDKGYPVWGGHGNVKG